MSWPPSPLPAPESAPEPLPEPITLRTARLILRPWRDADRDAFAALNADARVMQHFPSRLSRAESDLLFDRVRQVFAQRGYGMWAVEAPTVAEFIGFTGLGWPRFTTPFTPCVEVGWRLGYEFWGRGYAVEAARAAISHGFAADPAVAEIVAFTAPANRNSRRVMEKLGMHHDSAADFDHPTIPADHPLCRHVLYRLPRADWHVPE